MKRLFKSVFLIAAVFCVFASNGQGVVVSAGVNSANMSYDHDGEDLSEDFKALLGLNIGVHAELPLGDIINFEPGVTFNQRGYRLEESDAGTSYKGQLVVNYVDIPLNVRAQIIEIGDLIISVAAGPYVGMALSGKGKSETTYMGMTEEDESDLDIGTDNDDDIAPLDFGAGAQAGIAIGKVTANIFYTQGLANVANGEKADAKHNFVGAKVGFKILGD